MKKKYLFPAAAFLLMLIAHIIYSIYKISKISSKWFYIGDINPFLLYLRQQDYFLGLSYAAAFAFTIYAFLKFIEGRSKSTLLSVVGGAGFTGILNFGLCFLLGCCGSPLLPVYLSLFGSYFLSFTKPLTFLITTISVTIGFIWINKKKKNSAVCCGENEKCIDKKAA